MAAGAQDALFEYPYLRTDPAGPHRDLRFHEQGDRSWLVVTRSTDTREITAVELARGVARDAARDVAGNLAGNMASAEPWCRAYGT